MSDLPPRLTAALADRYRLERELGQGGMATVYLAEDLKHGRRVAIKVLKPELAAVLGADRFVQEIATTAALQHPNILPLFDSGTADGFLYYVMPYVEGESLRDRLNREKQLPVREAVDLTSEVADALEYAHEHGVVHRDVKPENILIHAGRPMVADFGIALAVSAAAGGRMTETGLSLGTPHYMSPEQATAEPDITGRSDVYSLASVLYEMLTGDPPHTGSSAQQIIMKIVTEEAAPVTKLRRSVPPNVAAAVAKALEKLPADRFESARAFADALADPGFRTAAHGSPSRAEQAATAVRWRRVSLVLGAVTLLSLAGLAWALLRGAPSPGSAVVRFTVRLPAGVQPTLAEATGPDLAVSPDGSTVAFPATDRQGGRQLYVRRVDEEAARAVPGTEGALVPLFSSDGSSVLFYAAGRVQKVALAGGAPQVVGEIGSFQGYSLEPAGGDVILATPAAPHLVRVSATGERTPAAIALDTARGETAQFFPRALPDGRHVLYLSWGRGATEDARIGVLDLSTGRVRRLDVPGTYPLGMLDGNLIYGDQTGTVLAVPVDLSSGRVGGEPVPLLTGVATASRGSIVAALSPSGTLAYEGGSPESTLELASPAGATPLLPDERAYANPRFSPDGRRVAISIATGTSSDIWLEDVASGGLTRLTSGGAVNERPEWSPDGSRVIFRTLRGRRSALWWQAADGSAPATPLLADSDADYFEGVMTPDGHGLVFQVDTGGADVLIRDLRRDGQDRAIAATPADEDQPRVSPDGRWVAYQTNESGTPQVVVQALSGSGGRVQVSIRGGTEPVWSPDGRRIFYRADGKFRVAEISAAPTFHVLSRSDFMDDVYLPSKAPHANYDVSPDGKKLLVLGGEPPQLVVVHGWAAEVRAKLEP